ncbi:MAG: LuxR C-terminal-related transcriptional regulator [Candidatus Limnocylindrales bacterium]
MDDAAVDLTGRYTDALLTKDTHPRHANELLMRALDQGASLLSLYTTVIPAALASVGRKWEAGEISVADEHVATGIVRDGLYDLSRRAERKPPRDLSILVAAVDEELHDLPTRILSDVLIADGWQVLCVGAATPAESLARLVIDREPDVVALSVTMAHHLPALEQSIRRLREADVPPVHILIGGQGVSRASLLGADGAASRLDEAVSSLAAFADRKRRGAPEIPDLTERERAVLELIVEALTNREIAERLGVSEATAKTHVRHILEKLGLRSRVEAAALASRFAPRRARDL